MYPLYQGVMHVESKVVIFYEMDVPLLYFVMWGTVQLIIRIMSFWSYYENRLSPHLNLKSCLPVYWICIMLRYLRHYAVILTLNRYIKKWQTKKKSIPLFSSKMKKTQTITLGRVGHFFVVENEWFRLTFI